MKPFLLEENLWVVSTFGTCTNLKERSFHHVPTCLETPVELENTHPEQVADEHMIFSVDKWNPQERCHNMSGPASV